MGIAPNYALCMQFVKSRVVLMEMIIRIGTGLRLSGQTIDLEIKALLTPARHLILIQDGC
jgi:hypothetical protein